MCWHRAVFVQRFANPVAARSDRRLAHSAVERADSTVPASERFDGRAYRLIDPRRIAPATAGNGFASRQLVTVCHTYMKKVLARALSLTLSLLRKSRAHAAAHTRASARAFIGVFLTTPEFMARGDRQGKIALRRALVRSAHTFGPDFVGSEKNGAAKYFDAENFSMLDFCGIEFAARRQRRPRCRPRPANS